MIKSLSILHCDTWDLLPLKIRIKAFLGILSDEECKEYCIRKVEHKK